MLCSTMHCSSFWAGGQRRGRTDFSYISIFSRLRTSKNECLPSDRQRDCFFEVIRKISLGARRSSEKSHLSRLILALCSFFFLFLFALCNSFHSIQLILLCSCPLNAGTNWRIPSTHASLQTSQEAAAADEVTGKKEAPAVDPGRLICQDVPMSRVTVGGRWLRWPWENQGTPFFQSDFILITVTSLTIWPGLSRKLETRRERIERISVLLLSGGTHFNQGTV